MNNRTRNLALWTAFTLITVLAKAQDGPGSGAEMADAMRANGKIYVVVAVILTILAGLIFYLVRIDRKVSRLEKENR